MTLLTASNVQRIDPCVQLAWKQSLSKRAVAAAVEFVNAWLTIWVYGRCRIAMAAIAKIFPKNSYAKQMSSHCMMKRRLLENVVIINWQYNALDFTWSYPMSYMPQQQKNKATLTNSSRQMACSIVVERTSSGSVVRCSVLRETFGLGSAWFWSKLCIFIVPHLKGQNWSFTLFY